MDGGEGRVRSYGCPRFGRGSAMPDRACQCGSEVQDRLRTLGLPHWAYSITLLFFLLHHLVTAVQDLLIVTVPRCFILPYWRGYNICTVKSKGLRRQIERLGVRVSVTY